MLFLKCYINEVMQYEKFGDAEVGKQYITVLNYSIPQNPP